MVTQVVANQFCGLRIVDTVSNRLNSGDLIISDMFTLVNNITMI